MEKICLYPHHSELAEESRRTAAVWCGIMISFYCSVEMIGKCYLYSQFSHGVYYYHNYVSKYCGFLAKKILKNTIYSGKRLDTGVIRCYNEQALTVGRDLSRFAAGVEVKHVSSSQERRQTNFV